LALLLACLLLERWAARMPSLRRELLLGAAIGLSALVRSVNVLLVPAIVLARTIVWFRSGRGRASPASFAGQQVAPLALAAALILLPWGVRNQLVNPAPPADQVTVYSYSAGMWHSDRGDPDSPTVEIAEVLDRVPDRVIQLVHVLGSALAVNASGSKPPDHGVAPQHALFALLLLLGLTYGLAKRREPMEFFALGALATISIYFSFQNRLVLPIYVICLGATVEMGRDLVRRVASPRVAVVAVALALVVLALFRFEPRRGWDRIRENHLSMLSDVAAIERVSEPDACLAASAGFHYTLYLERPVYSLQMAIRRAGGVQGAEAMIDKYGVDTLALFGDKKMERELLAYARSKYGPGQRVGTGYLFRVRAPGTPCGSRRR
jgi:hypothetical protein